MDYIGYIVEEFMRLVAIPSPSGMTRAAAEYTKEAFEALGCPAHLTRKGCVLAELGGEGEAVVLCSHLDTLGAMVAEIKGNGGLRLSRIGGLGANNIEAENCAVVTRSGKTYGGTCQLIDASLHVNLKNSETKRDFDTVEVLLDEVVGTREEVEKLGVCIGDYVCFDPRAVYTESGFLKSRFIDDKLSVAVLLSFARYLRETGAKLRRKVYAYVTVYEEIGHGACASVPEDAAEMLVVDMGCVGAGLACRETQVSICAKDSSGPSDYGMTGALIDCAKKAGIDYAVDIYPSYGSDADAALRAGYDMRHCVIGSGVYASHGYERTHRDGIAATFNLLKAYLLAAQEK
ncbi:MAG TPA: M42 family metallopeptidase [Clostridia bacterium]|nr:M42 family metallopeptidase [Clostridia bacterium]